LSGPSHAYIAKLFGWDLSKDETYQQVNEYVDIATGLATLYPPPPPANYIIRVAKVVLVVIDPPAESALISGRVSLEYDSSFQALGAGWFGEFGADTLRPAPPVPVPTIVDVNGQLQQTNNAAMVSANISSTPGRTVFEFDWGPSGFVATRNADAEGHVNFAGLVLSSPTFEDAIVGTPSNFVQVAGSREETAALGTASQTYLLCAGGYCGANPIPEPSTFVLMTISLAFLLAVWRLPRNPLVRKPSSSL
jgi:hypothetical protein